MSHHSPFLNSSSYLSAWSPSCSSTSSWSPPRTSTSSPTIILNLHLQLYVFKMLVPTLRFAKKSLQIRVYSYFPILLKNLIIPSIGSASPSFKNIQKSVSPFFFFKWFSWLKLLMWMVCFRERLFVELFYFWVYLPQTPNPFIRKSKNISFLVITADWSLY